MIVDYLVPGDTFRWFEGALTAMLQVVVHSLSDIVAVNMDIEATAAGKNKAVDLVVNDVKPKNGVISMRFSGAWIKNAEGKRVQNEAIAQAIEIGPGDGGVGAVPAEVAKEVLEE